MSGGILNNGMRWTLVAGTIVLAGAVLWYVFQPPSDVKTAGSMGVRVPDLSAEAEEGAALFAENCAACHGPHASGGEGGPPLIHKIYEPNHHGDGAFLMAARNGVRQHHWRFGNMPRIDTVSDADVARIVTYVREVQRANGIE